MANQIDANLIRLFVSELRVRQDLSSCSPSSWSTVRVCTYLEKSSHCSVVNGVHEQSMLTPAAVHVLNGSRPFTPLKLSGHDWETCVLTSKATNNVSWTWRGLEQTPSNGHWEKHMQYAVSTQWMSDKSWSYHPLLIKKNSTFKFHFWPQSSFKIFGVILNYWL